MPFRYDTEEEQQAVKRQRSTASSGRSVDTDTEIALGTRSLLAIFFGLVLICAVFFGLGYSVGRGSGTRAAAEPTPGTSTAAPDSHSAKPSPEQTLTPVEASPTVTEGTNGANPAPATPATQQPGSAETRPAASAPAPSPGAPAPLPVQAPQRPAPAPTKPSPLLQPAAATVGANVMVQVAAVRVPQDAQILVDALKRHGYTAVVRNEPQDQLLHIQLGPFPSRADAMAMRAKLLTDGYNAVVK
jgi:DedD protein